LDFVPGAMRASSITSKGALTRFDFDINELASPDLAAARVQFHMRRDPSLDALDVVMSGESIRLSPQLRAGFGDAIPHFEVEARLLPGSPFVLLLAGKSEWRKAAEAWRLRGGRLSVDKFTIGWGKLDANGFGSLALDDKRQFSGGAMLAVSGLPESSAAAAEDEKLASAFLVAASRFQNPSAAPKRLTIPLAFRDGNVSAKDIPAGSIGPLY